LSTEKITITYSLLRGNSRQAIGLNMWFCYGTKLKLEVRWKVSSKNLMKLCIQFRY